MPFDSGLSVLAWAQERHDNSVQIASTKTGSDRVGWQEDAAYWSAIIDAIRHSASWRCFQCGMVLTTEHEARGHFGDEACVSVQHERERQSLRAALAETRRVLRRFATVTQERGVSLPSDLVSDVRAVLAQM